MSATSASRLVKLSASEKSVNRDEVPPSVRVLARISALTKAPLESVARGVSMNWYQDSGVSTTRPTIFPARKASSDWPRQWTLVEAGKRRWILRIPEVPEYIWLQKARLHPSTDFERSDGAEVDADKWIAGDGAEDYCVVGSDFSNGYDIFTLLWWKDASQL